MLRRVGDTARTRVVRRAAADSGLPVGEVRKTAILRTSADADSATITMRAAWLPLYKLGGAEQSGAGTTVLSWGMHRHTLVAKMKSGHVGVFRRVDGGRLPTRELWGPNPVAEVFQAPADYRQVLADVAETHLMPRVLHELDRLLAGGK